MKYKIISPEIIEEQKMSSPLIAAMLSILMPGLGFFYSGKLLLGISNFGIMLLIQVALFLFSSKSFLVCVLLATSSVILGITFWVWSILAARNANRNAHYWQRKWILVIFLICHLALGFFLDQFKLYQTFNIPTQSMFPSLIVSDTVMAEKTNRFSSKLSRGDLVVFKEGEPSGSTELFFVKRIIGIPGDQIEIDSQQQLSVNGQKIIKREFLSSDVPKFGKKPEYVREKQEGSDPDGDIFVENFENRSFLVFYDPSKTSEAFSIKVPEKSYFVIGDNRNNSFDSRNFGPISEQQVVAKLGYVLYNFDFELLSEGVQKSPNSSINSLVKNGFRVGKPAY